MITELNAITFKSQRHPKHRFQNLYGLLREDFLYQSWGQLNKQAAAGIDGITMPAYQQQLVGNITRLSDALKHKRFRANDSLKKNANTSKAKRRSLKWDRWLIMRMLPQRGSCRLGRRYLMAKAKII